MIVLAGLLGGVLTGVGVVLLTAPAAGSRARQLVQSMPLSAVATSAVLVPYRTREYVPQVPATDAWSLSAPAQSGATE